MQALYHKKHFSSSAILLLVLAVALFFRFWKIVSLPGGLFPDEAANGLDVNAILAGHWQPFYERGNGREALFFYFLALVVKFFGRGPGQHHVVSAAFGFAAVVVCYFLTKKLFTKNVALLAAFFMAVSSFALTISRTAFRANTVPFFATLTLLLIVKFFESPDQRTRYYFALAAGAVSALGFYTYTSFRMMAVLLLFFLVILLFGHRGRLQKLAKYYRPYFLAALAGFAIFIFPLARYFLAHPESFLGRAGQVSIFSPDLNRGDVFGTFLAVLKKTLLGFFTQGDLNWRHNVSGFPFLSPILAPLFTLGLIIMTVAIFSLIKQAWQKNIQSKTLYQALAASWFWLMLAPEVLTAEGIPHGLRLIGVIPVMFIFPAWTADQIWSRIKTTPISLPLAVVFFVSLSIYNYQLYFRFAASSPDYYYAFRSDLTTVSNYLNKRNNKAKTYLSLDKFSVQTVDYLTTETGQPYILLDPAATYLVKLTRGDEVVFTQSTLYDRIKFLQTHPQVKLIKTEKNQFSEIIMLAYEQP